ncbi:hypothetical protein LRP49_06330 [Enterovibrio sp. ZSDZ35]|uniref:LPP20 lipoprotein n=1 Tax=Enterovibrio qingdaonensis TaxID=2899818 RepID=A0ABT5QIK1_9GAMM|nr:hypothetical protein [Enterovibrio sp. ZSDZ35]MDD1780815.1 hypothetical protein [Enterovibrio sp. ZSDZ35]
MKIKETLFPKLLAAFLVFNPNISFSQTSPVHDSRYVFFSGIGETQDEALKDGAARLARSINSTVTSDQTSTLTRVNGNNSYTFSQTNHVEATPLALRHVSVVKKICPNTGCTFEFKILKDAWISTLKTELNNAVISAKRISINSNSTWKGAAEIISREQQLLTHYSAANTLDTLTKGSEISTSVEYRESLGLSKKYVSELKIKLHSSNDSGAQKVLEELIPVTARSTQGNLIVVAEAKPKFGKSSRGYIAKQQVSLKFLESSGGAQLVKQHLFTTQASSDKSHSVALDKANEKLMDHVRSIKLVDILE